MLQVQECNLWCLPENYQALYHYYHFLAWRMVYIATDHASKVSGYVLAKMEENKDPPHSHITSLAVKQTSRKFGLAKKVMVQAMHRMADSFGSNYVSLHVRESNQAAKHLYSESLGYEIVFRDYAYYADGEDAYYMEMYLQDKELVKKRQKLIKKK